MNVKRLVKKMSAIVAGATMIGATVMGAMAYDLGSYPAPFIKDGALNGKIVVGEKAASKDILGAIDISASLQAAAVTEEPVDIPGLAGEVSLSGINYKIETPSDKLELREPVSSVVDTITESELPALKSGSITTSEGTTDYNQYIRFAADTDMTDFGVNFIRHPDTDEMKDFLVIPEDKPFFEWEIEFTEGLESSVETDGRLQDMEDKTINVFGTDYSIVKATLSGDDADGTPGAAGTIDLVMMGGSVPSTLQEGESKTYTIDGVDYVVTLSFVSDPQSEGEPEAKFQINGEMTETLAEGDTTTLSNGLQIGVRDILVNPRAGSVSFFLGADKIEFTDVDTTDGEFDGTVEINNENINDASVRIVGDDISSTKYEITNIKYRLTVDSSSGDVYAPAGHGVKEYLRDPASFLSPTFDIKYEGLSTPDISPIKLDAIGDDRYELEFTNMRGTAYKFPFFDNDDGTLRFGDDNDDFVFVEATNFSDPTTFNIGDNDFFVLTEDKGDKSVSTVLRFDDVDDNDRTLYFTYEYADGAKAQKTITYGDYDANGVAEADLVVEGTTYKVYLNKTASDEYVIAVDMNANGAAGDQIPIYVKGGAKLDLVTGWYDADDSTAATAIDIHNIVGDGQTIDKTTDFDTDGNTTTAEALTRVGFTMDLVQEADNFDTTTTTDGVLSWKVYEASNEEVDLGSVDYTGPLTNNANVYSEWSADEDGNDSDYTLSMTDFGALVKEYNPSGDDANELTIEYPEVQRTAQVFVVSGDVEATTSAAGVTTEKVNPLGVELAVLDVNAPAVGTENLIVVGGPCANTVAAELLGNPAVCSEGFEPGKAMIKSFENNGYVAILVAGYEADDTVAASRILANYEDYQSQLSGMSEVEVVTANLNDIQIKAPTVEETTTTEEDTTATE